MSNITSRADTANASPNQTATAALAANTSRRGWAIQNASTNTLYVLLGTGTASSTLYHFALKACTGANDGSGGSISQSSGVVYAGVITVGGTSPSYAVMEL